MKNSEQLFLIVNADMTPLGDGSYTLKPRKPEQWLWTNEAAKVYRVSPDTIVRWWRLGYIVGRKVGPRRIQVDAQSLVDFSQSEGRCKRTENIGVA